MKQFYSFGKRRTRKVRSATRFLVETRGYGRNWRHQKKLALERDNRTCQKCGSIDRVSVHHIRKIAWFVDLLTETIDYDAANDLENLVTLCMTCHKVADGHKKMIGFKSFV